MRYSLLSVNLPVTPNPTDVHVDSLHKDAMESSDIPRRRQLAAVPIRFQSLGLKAGLVAACWGLALVSAHAQGLASALDTDGSAWTTGGSQDGTGWFGQSSESHDGVDAAQSGVITHRQTTWMETTVTGACQVVFWWKVSSESYDHLTVYVDGSPRQMISGETDWLQGALSVSDGVHTCRWEYAKDSSTSEGSDAGWVDQIGFLPPVDLVASLDATNLTWTTGGLQDGLGWFGQGGIAHDGVDAAQSGAIMDDRNTWMEAMVTGPCMLSFWWKVSSEEGYDFLEFNVDNELASFVSRDDAAISGEVDWQRQSVIIGEGPHACLWIYTKDTSSSEGADAGWVDQVEISPFATLSEALDAPNLTWTNGGDAEWFGWASTTHDGTDAAQSGTLDDDGSAYFQTTATGPGTLGFWWKVSSEYGYDHLEFLINGNPSAAISGEEDWRQESFPLPDGDCTLLWRYAKDDSDSAGADAGWVDEVVFTATTGPSIAIIAPPQDQRVMPGDLARFEVFALGEEPLAHQWQYEGTALQGQTNQWLQIQPVQDGHVGNYQVVITNSSGAIASASATLDLLPWELEWQQGFGGSDSDMDWSVCLADDGGCLIGGSSSSTNGTRSGPSFGYADFWATRIDSNGGLVWEASFGGNGFDVIRAIAPASDGGFLLAGLSSSAVSGNKTAASHGGNDFWVVRIDADGNKLWDQSFGGSGNDQLWAAKALPDGGFALVGYSSSGATGNKTSLNLGGTDFWLVRLDSAGTRLWDQSFGGSGNDQAYAMDCAADGGFILVGNSDSAADANKTSPSFGDADFWIVRANTNGVALWDAAYGGTDYDSACGVQPAKDGGWWIGGESMSGSDGNKSSPVFGMTDFWLVLIDDSSGTKGWEQSFGGYGEEYFTALGQTLGGELLLVGESGSGAEGTRTRSNYGASDGWLVCLDADGEFLWDYAFGGLERDWLNAVQTAADGGVVLGAISRSDLSGNKTIPALGGYDFWPIKIRPDQVQPAPALSISLAPGNTVMLAWPVSASNWVLEWIDSLPQEETPWFQLAPPYEANSTNLQYAEPSQTGSRFYRLRRQ